MTQSKGLEYLTATQLSVVDLETQRNYYRRFGEIVDYCWRNIPSLQFKDSLSYAINQKLGEKETLETRYKLILDLCCSFLSLSVIVEESIRSLNDPTMRIYGSVD